MHPVLSLGLALTLTALEPATSQPEVAGSSLTGEQCRAREIDFFVSYGPATAPTLMRVYLDPTTTDNNPLQTWLEIRRIAGERTSELRVEIVTTRGSMIISDPEADSVRLWFMAVASLGRAEEALREIGRQDWIRVAVELRSEEGAHRLASAVGLDVESIDALRLGASGSCLRHSLDQGTQHVAGQTRGNTSAMVGVIASDGREQFQFVDAELTDLRTQLDRLITAPTFVEEAMAFVPFGPGLSGRSSRLDRTFPAAGVLVGGEALPHRLIIFVEDEENGRLPDWLSPAMQFRTKYPGDLSVQLIAAGVGTRAINLRRRLCAARTLGLEVEFLLHLAEPPSMRRLHEADLNEVIQPIADSDACSDVEVLEPDEDQQAATHGGFGHPRGAWLDGRPVNPSDLDNLEYQLDTQLHPSLIDWLSAPDILATEPMGFEF